jgi:threonine dehydrogenase-like Zn-dependent dehydrogenase
VKAVTVVPRRRGTARLEELPEPDPAQGSVLVEGMAVGVCATDREIVDGNHGWAPSGRERLVLGHESLGRVIDPGSRGGLSVNDIVVGIVRRPDPKPCANCAAGECDMCTNGLYTEHGINLLDGFLAQRWRVEPEDAVKLQPTLGSVGVLLEPTTAVAKAWERAMHVASRAFWEPQTVVVTGDGPVALLAALLGVQRGLEIHVLGLHRSGSQPELATDVGATYHIGSLAKSGVRPDLVIETTGSGKIVLEVLRASAAGSVVCLTGLGASREELWAPASELSNEAAVKNLVVVGSVNANRRHYYKAARALADADRSWLERLVSRRVPLDCWRDALQARPDDLKVVIDMGLR